MHSNPKTLFFVSLFSIVYLYFTARQTAHQKLDFYDLVMLSSVAALPWSFVLFPSLSEWIAEVFGVAFPFVILFGALIAIVFVFIHRLTAKVHQLESDNRLLVQEISLLKKEEDPAKS